MAPAEPGSGLDDSSASDESSSSSTSSGSDQPAPGASAQTPKQQARAARTARSRWPANAVLAVVDIAPEIEWWSKRRRREKQERNSVSDAFLQRLAKRDAANHQNNSAFGLACTFTKILAKWRYIQKYLEPAMLVYRTLLDQARQTEGSPDSKRLTQLVTLAMDQSNTKGLEHFRDGGRIAFASRVFAACSMPAPEQCAEPDIRSPNPAELVAASPPSLPDAGQILSETYEQDLPRAAMPAEYLARLEARSVVEHSLRVELYRLQIKEAEIQLELTTRKRDRGAVEVDEDEDEAEYDVVRPHKRRRTTTA